MATEVWILFVEACAIFTAMGCGLTAAALLDDRSSEPADLPCRPAPFALESACWNHSPLVSVLARRLGPLQ